MPNSRIETKRTEEQMKIETKINYSLRMLHIRLWPFDHLINDLIEIILIFNFLHCTIK